MSPRDPRPASAFDLEVYGPVMPHRHCPDRHVTHDPHTLFAPTLAYCDGLAAPPYLGPVASPAQIVAGAS